MSAQDVATGKDLQAKNKSERGEVAIFAGDGKTYAWANGFKGTLSVRDIESDKEIRTLDGISLRFSTDSKLAALRAKDDAVIVYDLDNGKELHKLTEGTSVAPAQGAFGPAYSAAEWATGFSADGKKLAYGAGNRVRQWEVTSGKEIVVADGHFGAVSRVALTADGKTALSRGADGTLRLWDAATGKQLHRVSLLAKAFHAVFSADGHTLALSGDGNVWVCDARTGKVVRSGSATGGWSAWRYRRTASWSPREATTRPSASGTPRAAKAPADCRSSRGPQYEYAGRCHWRSAA